MSSLRNAVKRVTHKERSQPQSRTHLGILEKKKDYGLRARDYHKKQDRIQNLRRKASMRNPDEFYFGMNRAEVKEGTHRTLQNVRQKELESIIGADAVKLMKGQDLSYVRLQRQSDRKKIERMRESLHLIGDADADGVAVEGKRHTIFVDTKEDAESFDVAEHFGTVPELAGRSFNRLRKEALLEVANDDDEYDDDNDEKKRHVPTEREVTKRAKDERRAAKKIAKARAASYREMEARAKRMAEMEVAEAHLNTERLVAARGRKRKIKGAEDGRPAVYKWRRIRAR